MEKQATFTIDDENFFEGSYDPSDLWNGFAVPRFDWENAVKIADWLNQQAKKFPEDSTKALIRPEAMQIHIIEGENVDVFDGPTYAIGAGAWCWTVKGE